MLIEHIKQHWNKHEEARSWSNGLRASSSGKCARAIAYQYHGYDAEPLNWRARLVFRLGDIIESDLVGVARLYGLTDEQKECSITIDGVEIKGHVDGILGDTVVDFKSTTTFGFKKAKGNPTKGVKEDVGDYLFTMHFYMKALSLEKALLVYYCKEQSDLHEVSLKYDPKIWDMVEERFRKVILSKKDSLPDREFFPNEKGALPWQCSYCSFNRQCWPEYSLAFDGAGKPHLYVKENHESTH